MTVSNANLNPANLELTPCKILFDGVDLGGSLSNVKISFATKKADLHMDQLGETVVDRRVSGHEYKIETVLSEINNPDIWKVVFPNLVKLGAGPYALYQASKVGESDYSLAKELVLHPLSRADADKLGDYTFFKVCAESVSEVVFGPKDQQGLKVVWNVYPDFSVIPQRFWVRGDSTINLIPARAGAPAYTGTGNGVLSAVVVYSGYTLTENITLTCVGIPSANHSNWKVEGSVSGAIGNFAITLGSANFVSNKISFTLADGTTDFVIGDNFVIATVAANYV